jgi:3-oxoacyl-[acyl-carrier-protein] synthase II
MAASVLALAKRKLPPTLNYERPDPACPVNVIHGAAADVGKTTAVILNHAPAGQSAAIVIDAP